MIRLTTGLVTAVALAMALGAAGPLSAQPSAPETRTQAPPFDINSDRAARRWMTQNHIDQINVEEARWMKIGANDLGVLLAKQSLETAAHSNRTTPIFVVRLERYRPATPVSGRGTTLSELVLFEVNCITRLARLAQVIQYPRHNLGGGGQLVVSRAAWVPVSQVETVNSEFYDICAATDLTPAFRERPAPAMVE